MTKQLVLCLMACMLAIAPGCSKRTKNLASQERNLRASGIGLATAGSIMTAGGAAASFAPLIIAGPSCIFFGPAFAAIIIGVPVGVAGLASCGTGVYMLVKGIDNLARAKQIRRMQAKEAAQQRKLAEESTAHDNEETIRETVLSQEQIENEQKKHRVRGIALTTVAPFGMVAGAALANAAFVCGEGSIIGGAILFGAGVCCLGQGIHDLAKAKTLRRIQMKEAAQQRKLQRELDKVQTI